MKPLAFLLRAGLGLVLLQFVRLAAQPAVFVTQLPLSQNLELGAALDLSVEVTATEPEVYTWFFNGIAIPSSGGPRLQIPAVSVAQAGTYSVRVTTLFGYSVTSRSCVVDVMGSGGTVMFSNSILDRPVYDLDGTTLLAGEEYLAQLYAGPKASALVPVGAATPFGTGAGAGYWRGGIRSIPAISPGAPCVAQVRIWQSGRGRTFEEATRLPGKFGVSPLVDVPVTGGVGIPPTLPVSLGALTSFAVSTIAPPAIVTPPANTAVNAGARVVLSVAAGGGIPLRYQWQFNGTDLPGATLTTYVIPAANETHAGSYRVRVFNAIGSVLSPFATLSVNSPGGTVRFSNAEAGAPVRAADGSTALAGDDYLAQLYAGPPGGLLVAASGAVPFGTGSAAGYWKGGIQAIPGLPPGTEVQVQVRVWPVAAGASFETAVRAGQPVGLSAILTVTLGGVGSPSIGPAVLSGLLPFQLGTQPFPEIVQELRPGKLLAGQPGRLETAALGLQPLTFEWRKNDNLLIGQTGPILNFPTVSALTAGSYSVTVRNAHGEDSSGPVEVQVILPPIITQPPASQVVAIGSRVTFAVATGGTAPFSYQWRYNGTDIGGAQGPTFIVDSAQPAQAGNYSVRVTNAAGTATSGSARLTVLTPPSIVAHPADLNVGLGEPVELFVTASGSAPLSFQWEKNGQPIPGATSESLALGDATRDTAGSYRVRVSNPVGLVVSRFATVTVFDSGGTVQFANAALRAAVTGEDGVTLLAGDDYLAQLYAGSSGSSLVPIPGAVPFGSGGVAGYWRGAARSLPDVAPGSRVFVQARIWETGAGASFEEAAATGRPVGLSAVLEVTTGGVGVPPTLPAPMTGLLPFSLTRDIAPVITAPLVPATAVFGLPFEITVGAGGPGPFTYEWQRNGRPIVGQTTRTFSVASVDDETAGSYEVVVRNVHGETRSGPVVVTVVRPPAIIAPPVSLRIALGSPARFEVQATGTAPLAYQWRRNGIELPNAHGASLDFAAVTPDLEGDYTVRISNAGGSLESAPARLAVVVPPTITVHPADFIGAPGAQFLLEVGVAGTAPFEFQWEFNGQPIPGATTASLAIDGAMPGASGPYRVRVRNAAGTALSRFAVAVINPAGAGTVHFSNATLRAPVSGPDGVTPLAGDRYLAQLYVGPNPLDLVPVQGISPFLDSPTTAGYWRSGTRAVAGVAPGAPVFAQVRVWETGAGASFEDAFRAGRPVGISATVQIVTGGLGVPPTPPAQLNGLAAFSLTNWTAPGIAIHPRPLTVPAGAAAEFTVIASGSEPLSYQWMKGDTDIPGAIGSIYRIASTQPSDQGTYRVRIRNPVGVLLSEAAALAVIQPPIITTHPASILVAQGAPAVLSVTADGTAPFSYQWFLQGQAIPGATGASITLSSTQPANQGAYTVRVSNAAGSPISSPAQLTVVGLPVVTQPPAPLSIQAGTTARFSVAVQVTGPVTYAWLRDGDPIPGANASVLEIPGVRTADAGVYLARIGSIAGYVDSSSASLAVYTLPVIEEFPTSQVITDGDPVTFRVLASGTGPLSYEWTRNGTPLQGVTGDTLQIASVASADAGSYQVRVSNPHGNALSPAFTLDVGSAVPINGVAVDGYIAGATVFFDANRDSFLDPGEPFAITDDQGRFNLDVPLGRFDTNKNGRLDPAEGRLVRIGGRDLATGLVSDIPAIGPAGSAVLGPLSSLIEAMQSGQPGLTVEDAERLVSASLGLPVSLPLTRVDPIAAAAQNLPGATALIAAAAQVQDTLVQIVSLVDGAAGGSVTAADHFLDALAGRVLDRQPVDLAAHDQVADLLNETIDKEGLKLPEAVVDAARQVVAEGNAAKQAAAESGSPLEVAALIARIQSVLQGATAGDLAEAGAGNQDDSDLLRKHTGGHLARQVDTAPAGNLLGTETRAGTFTLSATAARILEDGTIVEPLSVIRSDGNRGAVRVVVAFSPGSASIPADLKAGPLFLDFADGELVKDVTLDGSLIDDTEPEPEKSFTVTLHLAPGAPASARLGSIIQAGITLDDDDRAGTFQFDGTALQMNEDGTFVRRLFVERTGGLKGSVTVNVSTRRLEGGALPGVDFQPVSTRLSFAPGQRLAQVLVPVIDDSLFEGTERVGIELALAQPSSPGAVLGERTSAALEILNNDRRLPDLRFDGRAGDGVSQARVRVSGPPGQRVGIEFSDNLLDWKTGADGEIGPEGHLDLPFDITTPVDQARFYRFGPKR